MSDAFATRIDGAATSPGDFRALWARTDRAAFRPWPTLPPVVEPAPPPAAPPPPDPWAEGYAAGFSAARMESDTQAERRDRLAMALDRLAPVPSPALAEALAARVLDLLSALVGTASVDRELLLARCAELAALASDADSATLVLHPDDAALLGTPALGIAICTDSTLHSGEVRLRDGLAAAEAGPLTALAALRQGWTAPC